MSTPNLAEIKRRADEREALEEAAADKAANEALEKAAQRKDAAMTRAFKGICPTPERRKALERTAARR